MEQELQNNYLTKLKQDNVQVSVFLVNGIKLQGKIESFDDFAIFLENKANDSSINKQMIYKHAVSTVVPNVTKAE